MVAQLHLQIAADDYVALLTLMGGDLDGSELSFGGELGLDIERLGNTVTETVSQVVVGHAVGLLNALSLALAGESVAAEAGCGALDKLRNVNAQSLGAHIEEGEVQILLAGLVGCVFVGRDADFLCHILLGVAEDGAQFLNTAGYLHDFEFKSVGFLHSFYLQIRPGNKKPSPEK